MSKSIYTGQCPKCQNHFTKEIKWGHIPKFCSRSCANSRNHSEKTKQKISKKLKNVYSYTKIYRCPITGFFYHNKEEYKLREWNHYRLKTALLLSATFDFTLGNTKTLQNLNNAKIALNEMYVIQKMSGGAIHEALYMKCSKGHVVNLLKSLGIKRRTLSDSSMIALETGRSIINITDKSNIPYKHGWHIDWIGVKHYYRSSYELEYYRYLDDSKISYETETLRLRYYDSKKAMNRIAIPDIIVDATIYEIKSVYTFDPINMRDKCIKYNADGYNLILILNKQEYTINTPSDLLNILED